MSDKVKKRLGNIDKKHIVSVSGGLSSAIVLDLVIKRYGEKNTIAVFCDTLTEDVDLYRFNDDIKSRYPDLKWIRLCYGKNIWGLFDERNYHSNNRIAHCSYYLKQRIFRKWLKQHFSDPNKCIIYLGIGFEEMHRITPINKHILPYKAEYPLINWVMLMPSQKMEYFKDISPPRLYEMGFPHNNCGGCCVKSGQAQMKLLYEKLPEQYAWHEEQQERLIQKKPHLKPFIRVQTNKVVSYYSLRQFRELFLEKEPEKIDAQDYGGCGCFVGEEDGDLVG